MQIESMALTSPVQLSRKTLLTVLLSICYALFVVFFPWKYVSRCGFPDFNQYEEHFNFYLNKDYISFSEIYEIPTDSYQLSALKEYFTHEVLWFELVQWLNRLTGATTISLHIISFLILFVWGLFLLKRVSLSIALLFLFNPFAIDVAMSGIRNGLAWSLVILGLMNQSKALKAALFLTGMFIHSTTLVLVVFYYFTEFAKRFIRSKKLLFVGLGIGILTGLLLTVGNETVLGAFGDRRRGENYLIGGGSLMQASLWGILLYSQCISGRAYIRKNIFVIALLAFYLTMNLLIPWSFRIWSAFLPVIGASAMYLPHRKRKIFIYLYSGYLVLQYLYWTKLFNYWYWA